VAEVGESAARARLFFALLPTQPTRAALAAWQEAVLGGREELRLPPAESLHVTLTFLGARPEPEIAAIAAAGLSAVDGRAAPRPRPGGLVGVPRRRPRLLALDLVDPSGLTEALATAVAGALAAAGLHEPEGRPFWAHLTVARVRGGRTGTAATARALERPRGELSALPAELGFDRIALMRSHPGPRGARYEALESRGLSRSG
jgi:RNA 2',3'-cyclic 3'-phosphodiesterase